LGASRLRLFRVTPLNKDTQYSLRYNPRYWFTTLALGTVTAISYLPTLEQVFVRKHIAKKLEIYIKTINKTKTNTKPKHQSEKCLTCYFYKVLFLTAVNLPSFILQNKVVHKGKIIHNAFYEIQIFLWPGIAQLV